MGRGKITYKEYLHLINKQALKIDLKTKENGELSPIASGNENNIIKLTQIDLYFNLDDADFGERPNFIDVNVSH